MREIQTGLHKPEGGAKQRFTKSAENSAPVCFPNCASICLGSRVSFDLPLALDAKDGSLSRTICTPEEIYLSHICTCEQLEAVINSALALLNTRQKVVSL